MRAMRIVKAIVLGLVAMLLGLFLLGLLGMAMGGAHASDRSGALVNLILGAAVWFFVVSAAVRAVRGKA
jgi:uncharacterized membrane protein YeaQ/YmgE (transglycosylase-associated protein family)